MRHPKETRTPLGLPTCSTDACIAIRGASVYGLNNKASLIIPVNAIQGSVNVSTEALIDSGAQGNFIDESLASQFDTALLDQEIEVRNVDGTLNTSGHIK